jgi:hypothetical protein
MDVPQQPEPRSWCDRQFWLAAVICVLVMVPRSWHIAANSSPCYDDEYHLERGLWMLGGADAGNLNDPPLGQAIIALPLRVLNLEIDSSQTLQVVAVWKALLFVPGLIVAFHWCRTVYGIAAGWLALSLLLIDPTIAGHIPVAALDALAMESTIVAAFLVWRYVEKLGAARLIGAAAGLAVTILIKHTGIAVLIAAVVLVIWGGWRRGDSWRITLNRLAAGALLCAGFVWILCAFDISRPADRAHVAPMRYDSAGSSVMQAIEPMMSLRWPAGIYVASLLDAGDHTARGHDAYLWGEHRRHGWWYYYPAVALYKVPIGIGVLVLLGVASVFRRRPTWDEAALVVPALICLVLITVGGVNIGFRHALPAWGLILMLASRCVAMPTARPVQAMAWISLVVAAAHVIGFHPDYLSYTNDPWRKPYLAISDSNVDWGRSLPAVAQWLREHPDHQQVWLDCVGFDGKEQTVRRFVPDPRVHILGPANARPMSGLLIVSPWWLVELYSRGQEYADLRNCDPDAIIGHCMLVFDLDRIPAPVDGDPPKPQNMRN